MPSKAELRAKWDNAPENKVILHSMTRARARPNLSPFSMKLETYLRVCEIDYEFDSSTPFGSTGKMPWVTFNKKDYTDSQLVIELLAASLDKDPGKANTPEQRAVARGLRSMMEDHFQWCFIVLSMGKHKGKYVRAAMPPLPVPGFLQGLVFGQMTKRVLGQAHAQGMARHSHEDVEKFGCDDLRALSSYLGEKPFMLGDQPSDLDCSVFGILSQVLAGSPDDEICFKKLIADELPNLQQLFDRMKDKYWPDWDDLLHKDKEASAAEKKKEGGAEDEKEKDEDSKKDKQDGESSKEDKDKEEDKKE